MADRFLLGIRMSEVLQSKGMTQRELAEKTGLTEVSISRYMTGRRQPVAENIIKLATVLDISTDYLLGLSSTKSIREYSEKDICETFNAGYSCGRENGWIRTEDQMPQNFMSVLFCTSKEIIEVGYFDYLGDMWCNMSGDPVEFILGEEVTAWMPLPEACKEK